ncbi:MAG: DUF2851 family protein [Lentimicrobiaceae bacterium]|nr:DUF2851 family protein [Lentimicrobiaceae bacterium]
MDEKLLRYIWKYRLFGIGEYFTAQNDALEIVSCGTENNDSGPDFFDARVKIGNTLWAGCVELHLKSSDWTAHNHFQDEAYNNVVLHVVYEHDKDIFTPKGELLPTFELKFLIDGSLIEKYRLYMESSHDIVCKNQFAEVDSFRLFAYLDRLLVERLEEKTVRIEQALTKQVYNKEEVFYHTLADSFGFKTNALPFRLLAESLPHIVLAKQKDNLTQIEAMLFGQAGLLPAAKGDDYTELLKKEYAFLQRKFSLETLCDAQMWKFAKMYPQGFPTIRIAQFAALIYRSSSLLSKILDAKSTEELMQMFSVTASDYWQSHYQFGVSAKKANKRTLGTQAVVSLLINTVLPFLFAYSRWNNDENLRNRVVNFYENLDLETNTITRKYTALRPDFSNALHSQALIQLHNKYCLPKQCLHCGIGLHLLKVK